MNISWFTFSLNKSIFRRLFQMTTAREAQYGEPTSGWESSLSGVFHALSEWRGCSLFLSRFCHFPFPLSCCFSFVCFRFPFLYSSSLSLFIPFLVLSPFFLLFLLLLYPSLTSSLSPFISFLALSPSFFSSSFSSILLSTPNSLPFP